MELEDVPDEPEDLQAKAKAEQDGGLMRFHHALTKAALAKFDVMLELLGETSDWSAPGAACEAVIAEVLRAALPGRLNIDKGFIFGRRPAGGRTTHCPEIDLLVHDSCDYSPLCKIGGYVVVDPASVRAIIQVKRTATSDQIESGIQNVIDAKDHLVRSADVVPGVQPATVFSAVVTLNSILTRKDEGLSKTYKTKLRDAFRNCGNARLMPDFVGCLAGEVLLGSGELYGGEVEYRACSASYEGDAGSMELGFSLLLGAMYRVMKSSVKGVWPTIPDDVAVVDTLSLKPPKVNEGGNTPT